LAVDVPAEVTNANDGVSTRERAVDGVLRGLLHVDGHGASVGVGVMARVSGVGGIAVTSESVSRRNGRSRWPSNNGSAKRAIRTRDTLSRDRLMETRSGRAKANTKNQGIADVKVKDEAW
jgi:hypothetical protein